jgi:hypothetical protein
MYVASFIGMYLCVVIKIVGLAPANVTAAVGRVRHLVAKAHLPFHFSNQFNENQLFSSTVRVHSELV